MKRWFGSAAIGMGTALSPLAALAEGATAQAGSRAVATPREMGMVVLLTALAVTGLFVVTTLGYLYRRLRGLDWAFQAPAVPHDDHGAHH